MRKRIATFKPVMAAEEEMSENPFELDDVDSMQDTVEDMSDTLDDIQDAIEDTDTAPSDTVLDMENNISDHYVAECERCHEVFISAVVESETPVDSVEGECPCCHEHTTQYLKWIIRDVKNEE